jgi:hypothetical protein
MGCYGEYFWQHVSNKNRSKLSKWLPSSASGDPLNGEPEYQYGYTLELSKKPGSAYGGELFGVQPEVRVYFDLVLNTTFKGYVYAEIEDSPTGFEKLRYDNTTTSRVHGLAVVERGVASFTVGVHDCPLMT